MSASRMDLFRWQFDLTWPLLDLHLLELDLADFLWEPSDRGGPVPLAGQG